MELIINCEEYIIQSNATIYDCLLGFEVNNSGTLFVLKDEYMIGSITDGDIRKELVKNRSLLMPIKHIYNPNVHSANSKDDAIKILDKFNYIQAVPLLSSEGKLIGVYLR